MPHDIKDMLLELSTHVLRIEKRLSRVELRVAGAGAILWALGQLVGGAVDHSNAQPPAIVRSVEAVRRDAAHH